MLDGIIEVIIGLALIIFIIDYFLDKYEKIQSKISLLLSLYFFHAVFGLFVVDDIISFVKYGLIMYFPIYRLEQILKGQTNLNERE